MTALPGTDIPPATEVPRFTTLEGLARDREAFETAQWAIEALLEVELTTLDVLDPCSGTGMIGAVARAQGLLVTEIDVVDWSKLLPAGVILGAPSIVTDFLKIAPAELDLSRTTVVMNPPFSLAEAFVDHCRAMGARKIICFQRQAWRESRDRRQWWEAHSPARVWVCGARASCFRFDLLACQHGPDCPNAKLKSKRLVKQPGCQNCMGGAPTSHAWYVWERGHKGAEVTSAIYPGGG